MSDKNRLANYFRLLSRGQKEEKQDSDVIKQILDMIEALVIVQDTQGRIIEFNPACERLSGYSHREMLGKRVRDVLVPAEEKEMAEQVFQDALHDKPPAAYEIHWRAKSGKKYLTYWKTTNVKNKSAQVEYVIGAGLDISHVEMRTRRRELLLGIIEVLTGGESETKVLSQILNLVRDYAGCDAAAIRLRKGDDFPYVESVGFTEGFLQQESSLCTYVDDQAEGDTTVAKLECVCGRVI
ncbi:MAG: PAS domain-containing protein, partial [Bacillota bacterium]|nr:PAS domain-containing protein [Bacillota bacterium]